MAGIRLCVPSPSLESEAARASSSSLSICLSNGRPIFWTPITLHYEFLRDFAFCPSSFTVTLRRGRYNVLPDTLFQPFDDAANAFRTQADVWQGGNLSGAHSLLEIEPKNCAVPRLVRTRQLMFQMLIDLIQHDLVGNPVLTAVNLFAS